MEKTWEEKIDYNKIYQRVYIKEVELKKKN